MKETKAGRFPPAFQSQQMGIGCCWSRGSRSYRARRGIATFWLILFVPVFLVLLGLVVNVANLWLARVELENGLESAALAAVKEWYVSGSTSTATSVGIAYAGANTVRGQPISLTSGAFLFGAIYQAPPSDPICPNGIIFDATITPDCNPTPPNPLAHYGVLVWANVTVPSIWSNVLGSGFPSGQVQSFVTAVYQCSDTEPRLIRIDRLIKP